MKRNLLAFLIFCIGQFCSYARANEPDSAYLFAYTTNEYKRHNGLHFAWSTDGKSWQALGPEYKYMRCGYGREKSIIQPMLLKDNQGLWHCLWSLNNTEGKFAHAASTDLLNWKRQSYPNVLSNDNCLKIEVTNNGNEYNLTWLGSLSGKEKVYRATTRDFKEYSEAKETHPGTRLNGLRSTVEILGIKQTGTKHKVEWSLIDGLIKAQQMSVYKGLLQGERGREDITRFASLTPVEARIDINAAGSKSISDMLIGVFFEDINYSADGGLYGELIQNRDFEYTLSDTEGKDKNWNSRKAWKLKGEGALWTIDSLAPIHPNNKHYAKLEIDHPGAALANEGFDGIALKAGEKYYFSLFSRVLKGKGGRVLVRLVDKDGKVCGEAALSSTSADWKKQEIVLTSKQTVAEAQLEIHPQFSGTIALDMISLFPQKTFKGRRNGLRPDLAQTIADIKPQFMRFPGGCLAHGGGLDNMYRWKNTIGPLEARKPQPNLADYHQTAGLGYLEYFQFCEDIGAEPLPVVPAGVPCQNSPGGQQGGIPMNEMDDYVQEVLDLIEWANGGVNTKWGKIRANLGHPKPFNLKYLGVGNEDQISDIFEERFTMIYKAVKAKYPEITVIGTSGPNSEGTDYEEGWNVANKLGIPMVDEHNYQAVGWFLHNQDYYDRYDRNKSKVYLGEYAARAAQGPNLESALAEALHLTNIERNGDVVSMTSYAPLLAKEGHTTWNPDLIYFNNTEIKPTVGYYVQKLYGHNSGDQYLSASVSLSNNQDAVKKRVAISVVRDSKSKDMIVKFVNLLPVAVKASTDFKNITFQGTKLLKTVLQGQLTDKNATPVLTEAPLPEIHSTELAPYSFTILRIKTK